MSIKISDHFSAVRNPSRRFAIAIEEIRSITEKLDSYESKSAARHDELVAFLQREFTELFHRDQSLGESHCPSVFTLEIERYPAILPSVLEGWWQALADYSEPARLTLYCEQPGNWHPVKSYRFAPEARRLAELAPHLAKLALLFKVAGPLIAIKFPPAKPGIDALKSLAEAGAEQEGSRVPGFVSSLEEKRRAEHGDRLTLFTLRRLLEEAAPEERDQWGGLTKVLTKQFHYLWLCEEHARPHVASWASA